jgi:hypothetical protein
MKNRYASNGLVWNGILMLALLGNTYRASAQGQSLPVYHVDQFGATPAQASNLASALHIPPAQLTYSNGPVFFLDYTNYLAVPILPVTDPAILNLLQGQTVNESPGIPLQFQQINSAALSNLTVFDPNAALVMTSNALAAAGLTTQYGAATVAQPVLTTLYITNPFPWSVPLYTEVNYQFTLPGGYPLEGSGAQAQVAFGTTGNVTRLLYAVPQLSPGPPVQIIPMSTALSRAAALMDPTHSLGNLNLSGTLVYRSSICPPPCVEGPIFVLPWVKVIGSVLETNKVTGEISTLDLLPQYILGTDDPAFSPQVTLSASPLGNTQVVASVRVAGGMPPYTYTWSGSSPSVTSNTGPSVGYGPTVRVTPPPLLTTYVQALHRILIHWWAVDPDPHPWVLESSTSLLAGPGAWTTVTNDVQTSNGVSTVTLDASGPGQFFRLRLATQMLPANETVAVQVTDANGATVQVSQSVPVIAVAQTFIPAPGNHVVDWGTESPYDPGLGTGDRNDWRAGMILGGAGAERFLWIDTWSWKEDFLDAPAGINDFEVDNADITLYIGHGNPTVFTFTGGPGPNPTTLFYNEATQSWGNWDEEWLCLLSCEVLQYDWNGLKAWQRWGPNFDGLHSLFGFSSLAWPGTGFPKWFAQNMLGSLLQLPPQFPSPIISSWFSAAHACGAGTPAALGPIGPGNVCDYGDYFWGRGPVGPTIRASQIQGWWYLSY